MRPFVVSVSFLRKVVDKAARQRYAMTGDRFIEEVRQGKMDLPESDDLILLVKKHLLT